MWFYLAPNNVLTIITVKFECEIHTRIMLIYTTSSYTSIVFSPHFHHALYIFCEIFLQHSNNNNKKPLPIRPHQLVASRTKCLNHTKHAYHPAAIMQWPLDEYTTQQHIYHNRFITYIWSHIRKCKFHQCRCSCCCCWCISRANSLEGDCPRACA